MRILTLLTLPASFSESKQREILNAISASLTPFKKKMHMREREKTGKADRMQEIITPRRNQVVQEINTETNDYDGSKQKWK